MSINPILCCARIRLKNSFHHTTQCKNRAKMFWVEPYKDDITKSGHDEVGKPYCGIHDPSRRKKAKQVQRERFKAQQRKRLVEMAAPAMLKFLTEFVVFTKAIKDDNPRVPMFPQLATATHRAKFFALIKEARTLFRELHAK